MVAKRRGRPGAIRKKSRGKAVGSGGKGRRALEGRGPTPKAEDRPYHPKAKAKAARERLLAAQPKPRKHEKEREYEQVTGRNSVLEALKAGIPALSLHISIQTEADERLRQIVHFASVQNVPMLEVMRQEIDRMTSADTVHQGVVLRVKPYEYAHPGQLLEPPLLRPHQLPLIAMLDGITDPRNLGAIIRSVAAFEGTGVVIPQRRAAGVTSAAWKASAGAVAQVPVACASNLTRAIEDYKKAGVFVIGLDAGGEVSLPGLPLADRPLAIVIGNEGRGLSPLVAKHCDQIVSIPISHRAESLNASVAASITLYEVAQIRSGLRNSQ